MLNVKRVKEYLVKFQLPVIEDFLKVRKAAEDMDLFRPNAWFYVLHLAHIIALDVLGCLVMWRFGTGWMSYIVASILLATAQVCVLINLFYH